MKAITLVLLGAGDSTRFTGSLNNRLRAKKQWLRVGEDPLWKYVLKQFLPLYPFQKKIVVLSDAEVAYAKRYVDYQDVHIVSGGSSRQASLEHALSHVDTEYVLVSDVARCLIDARVCHDLFKYIDEDSSVHCVVPYVKVSDTTFSDEVGYLNRNALKCIQTPQLSLKEALLRACLSGDFSDESSAIYANGGKVAFIEGSTSLGKLTYWEDKFLLEALIPPSKEVFVGNGFDVHAFMEGSYIRLCGVDIPHTKAFKAHSDGDVAIHALIDAILGAMGAGDIGEWFPDTDPKYKGIDSTVLLEEVMAFMYHVGYEIVNVDLTIMAQSPKLAPYKRIMQETLTNLMSIPLHRVNIKATTTETLGFVGRSEGIAVSSSVTLKFFDWRSL